MAGSIKIGFKSSAVSDDLFRLQFREVKIFDSGGVHRTDLPSTFDKTYYVSESPGNQKFLYYYYNVIWEHKNNQFVLRARWLSFNF